jgi:uncharacterized protein YukE
MGTSLPASTGPEYFVPSEAQHIASRFCRLAAETACLSAASDSTEHRLSQSWEGMSRDEFFEEFSRHPAEFRNLGESIRRKAARIRTMHVLIWPGGQGTS